MLERTERRALDLAARAEVRKASVDEIFVVESLPLITGVIHGGSQRQNFERAKQHLVVIMPGSEAASGLSLLTLFYIVEKAWRRFQHSPSAHQKALWGDIRARVWRLL